MEQGRPAGAGCRVPPCCTRAPDALRIAALIRTTGFLPADGVRVDAFLHDRCRRLSSRRRSREGIGWRGRLHGVDLLWRATCRVAIDSEAVAFQKTLVLIAGELTAPVRMVRSLVYAPSRCHRAMSTAWTTSCCYIRVDAQLLRNLALSHTRIVGQRHRFLFELR